MTERKLLQVTGRGGGCKCGHSTVKYCIVMLHSGIVQSVTPFYGNLHKLARTHGQWAGTISPDDTAVIEQLRAGSHLKRGATVV